MLFCKFCLKWILFLFCFCCSCAFCLFPGHRRNIRCAAQAGLLLRVSRIHWCKGQRGAENLLCVHRHEQAAGYGAELRPGHHSNRLSDTSQEFIDSCVPQSAETADCNTAVFLDVAAEEALPRCVVDVLLKRTTLDPVGQFSIAGRWLIRTITIFFDSQTHLRLVISFFCTFFFFAFHFDVCDRETVYCTNAKYNCVIFFFEDWSF